jgi:hypothetical protein
VTVFVGKGDQKEDFVIHSKLICHYSPFFSAGFNNGFAEPHTRCMAMEDTTPAAFGPVLRLAL